MPHYLDYHRTIIGYHGTRRSTALKIVTGEQTIGPSENDDDWLGHGVYYWKYAPQQAWLWAKQRSRSQGWGEDVAVVAPMIRLGNCFDLLDPENVKELGHLYQQYRTAMIGWERTTPTNVRARKFLNCEVFEFTFSSFEKDHETVDSCRAVFVPTTKAGRIWAGSGINAHAHIQICVRNPKSILGTWLVEPPKER